MQEKVRSRRSALRATRDEVINQQAACPIVAATLADGGMDIVPGLMVRDSLFSARTLVGCAHPPKLLQWNCRLACVGIAISPSTCESANTCACSRRAY